jgi:hypothetical protein
VITLFLLFVYRNRDSNTADEQAVHTSIRDLEPKSE